MRVAVDVSSLASASDARGIGRYLRGALRALAARPELTVVAYGAPEVMLPEGVERSSFTASRWRRGAQSDQLAFAARADGADVFWSPAQSPPLRFDGPWVQTLHDLIPLVFPSRLTRHEVKRWRRVGPAITQAAAVICPSASSGRQGVELLGLDPERVHVVPHGLDPDFHPREVPAADPPYVLVVSAWSPHKGFAEAMAVVGELADRGYPHRLKLVGPNDEWMRKQIEMLRVASRRPDRVEVVGYVDDLAATYAAASVLICPSRVEGFGLPVAEAMACGVPVIAFDNSSLPEVIGDGGVLVPDGDAAAMARAVAEVIDDPSRAADLREAALNRAKDFSWTAAAESMAAIFRAVSGPRAPGSG